jgi:hypothetical protein
MDRRTAIERMTRARVAQQCGDMELDAGAPGGSEHDLLHQRGAETSAGAPVAVRVARLFTPVLDTGTHRCSRHVTLCPEGVIR